jgi:translation initiation factor IF-3
VKKINNRVITYDDPELKDREVMVVYEDGRRVTVSLNKAVKEAENAGQDLVCVAEEVNPPVCRIMDFSKKSYQKNKQEKKHKAPSNKVKEVKFSPNIGLNDYNVKVNQIRKFLGKKMRVKISLFFKGREILHEEGGRDVLDKVIADLGDDAVVDQPPKQNGKTITMAVISK